MQQKAEVRIVGQEWADWALEAQTQQFLVWLHQSVDNHLQAWLAGEFTDQKTNDCAQAVAQALARIAYTLENIEVHHAE
jgi:hypothetical protein